MQAQLSKLIAGSNISLRRHNMSSVSGVGGNFGFEALAVAMNKRAIDDQGQMALSLLEGTAQTVKQIQASAPQGNLGQNIDVMA